MPHDFETPQILHDAPLRATDQHHFHFNEFAVTVCRLIADKNTRTPLTIGVSGSWGSGKTTLLQRVKQRLDEAGDLSDATKRTYWGDNETPQQIFRSCKTVWFDAWKYSNEDQLLAALIRVVLATMAQGNLGDKFWSKVLDKSYPRRDVIATFLSFFSFKVDDTGVEFDIDKFKTETPLVQNTAFFDFFDEALEELMARWVHGTFDRDKIDEQKDALVIFIDDLDRCLPEKTVQVLEAIKLFLDKHGCVFVLGADLNVVRNAVETHYQNTRITGETASDYLEKIVQVRFEIPPILSQQMGDYLADDKDARHVVDGQILRHWSVLVIGAEINPRKVKTFINDVNLQWAMLKNTGQAEGINRDDFTLWQILMRAAPVEFVRQIRDHRDIGLRRKYVDEAMKWSHGEPTQAANFDQFAGNLRFKQVLHDIKFSSHFSAEVLDSFVHLSGLTSQNSQDVADGNLSRKQFGGVTFAFIPKGSFIMGSPEDNAWAGINETPLHSMLIPYDYWISCYPITNAQFSEFVKATEYRTLAERAGGWSAEQSKLVEGVDWRHPDDGTGFSISSLAPVVQISWSDAITYCQWLNETVHGELVVRLPTEAEWEKAARGTSGNEWPWGNVFDELRCNSLESNIAHTTNGGHYSPDGDSPYGVSDMAGNVWEWCHTLFRPYPYRMDDGREPKTAPDERVLRGGSYLNDISRVRCASRDLGKPDYRSCDVGFRVVLAPALPG